MNNKKLLIIERCNAALALNESKDVNGSVILEGTFTCFGVRNRNNRIYEANDVLPFIENLQSKVKSSTLLGELDHPESYEVSLSKASHVIEKLEYDQATNSIIGRVRLLNTSKGKEAQALVADGIPLHISSRAAGTVDANGRVKLQEMFTYDLVADPGFANAKLTRVNESFGFGDCDDIAIYDLNPVVIEEPTTTEEPEVTDTTAAPTPLVPSQDNEMAEYSKYLVGIISDLKKEVECLKGQVAKCNSSVADVTTCEPACSYTDCEIAALESKLNSLCDYVDELNNESNGHASNASNIVERFEKEIANTRKYAEYIAKEVENTQKYANYLGENLDKNIKFSEYIAENVENTQKYADYLGENLDKNIKFSEYIAENVENTQKYADYLGENLDKNIKFSEYIAENVENTQKYADYLGENLDKSIAFSNYLSENLDQSIEYSNYLGEQVDKTQKYGDYLAEEMDKTQQYADYVAQSINENNNEWQSKADALVKYSEHIAESVNKLMDDHDALNESFEKVNDFITNTNRGYNKNNVVVENKTAEPVRQKTAEQEAKIATAKSILESRKTANVSTNDLLASIKKFTDSVNTLNEAQQKIDAEKKAMEEQALNESYAKAGVNYLINNIPAELFESWSKLSKQSQDAILESAKCYELNTPAQIKHFWFTRNLTENFVQVEAPVVNVNAQATANNTSDIASIVRKRLGLC